jgi:hypothetical protein
MALVILKCSQAVQYDFAHINKDSIILGKRIAKKARWAPAFFLRRKKMGG